MAAPMPARADIDPCEIKPLLPYLMISDLFSDPLRVRFRLAGTKVCETFGFNVVGRWLEELECRRRHRVLGGAI